MTHFQPRVIAAAIVFLSLSHGASADEIQMLPPVTPGTHDPCSVGENKVLSWDGQNPLNCDTNFTIDPWSGDVTIGGSDNSYPPSLDVGPALNISGARGNNSDGMYFQRWNYSNDLSELRLYVGDNGDEASASSDFFTIGAEEFNEPGVWIPGTAFASNGRVGMGTMTPYATLEVATNKYATIKGILIDNASSNPNASGPAGGPPQLQFIDTSIGSLTAAPDWVIDSSSDMFRIYRQPNMTTAADGRAVMVLDNSNHMGVNTATPVATLDINGFTRLAKYSAQPMACAPAYDGSIALTHRYTLCVCNGAGSQWVQSKDGTSACSW